MQTEIERELERVVGGQGVDVTDINSAETANPRIKVETAEAVYELPATRFLLLLKDLPDHIGVNALRLSIEQHFPG
jgi:hypothetical protein